MATDLTLTGLPNGRACGMRKPGSIYIESRPGPDGLPLEHFLVDPPVEYRVPTLGIALLERDGITHLGDWVGEESWPNVADFIEEVRRGGYSGNANNIQNFGVLTQDSRILLVHTRAGMSVEDYLAYREQWVDVTVAIDNWSGEPKTYSPCPKQYGGTMADTAIYRRHLQWNGIPDQTCCGVYWNDIVDGDPTGNEDRNPRMVRRTLPSFSYWAACRPESVKPNYFAAIFLSLPLTNIVVIEDPDDRKHERALVRCQNAGVPVYLVEE
jgi:hypothetical protein